ncbi:hypothetical protein BBJ28_00025371, partial [Nothophytophthora sp. Chile5]
MALPSLTTYTRMALPPLTAFTSFALSTHSDSFKDHVVASTPKFSLAFILDDAKPLTPPVASQQPSHHPVTKERKRK